MSKWKQVLIEQCNEHGQVHVAKELGVSKTAISQLVNDKYPGDLERMQKLVEGAYMDQVVVCPILGEISLHDCDKHQRNTNTSGNPQRLRVYKACRSGCPHSSQPHKFTKPIPIQVQEENKVRLYNADAVIGRLQRQVESDGGGARQLCELLKQELKAVGYRFNQQLNRKQ
ncbi:MAG: helix-turn-helix domain-containing protein [Parashewanella sp.]